jgi:hypothetical protein
MWSGAEVMARDSQEKKLAWQHVDRRNVSYGVILDNYVFGV